MEGVELLELNKKYSDDRGYFMELYKQSSWPEKAQTNGSFSYTNTVRGLHYQLGEFAQTKYVQVFWGKIIDVVLDIRPNSKTFGKLFQIELTPGSGVLKIDSKLAHGFWALEPSVVIYHCDKEYSPSNEGCINPLSEGLGFPWLQSNNLIISEKDMKGQYWRSYEDSISFINSNN